MPVDNLKTHLQVHGKSGIQILRSKIKSKGTGILFHGATAAVTATYIGHYPWFLTFNYLGNVLPTYPRDNKMMYYGRSALIGLLSSFVSDLVSNCFRVIKTRKQTSKSG